MESSRLDRVQIDVAGEIVEIAWKERDTLLRRLRAVAVTLELWGDSVLPGGLARVLAALVGADPGGYVGTAFFGKTD
jgi:hypothetical protein